MENISAWHKIRVFLTTALIAGGLLSIVQLKVANPMLLSERFFAGFGWVQIIVMSILGGFLAIKMLNPEKIRFWRTLSWTIFSVVFFAQLILGLCGHEEFLMTGKLHLPIPAVIPGGAIFRLEFGFMPILFTATVFITGPAWCSQLCYFGALDNLSSGIRNKTKKIDTRLLKALKTGWLAIFILAVLMLRIFEVSVKTSAIIAGTFGLLGVLIIIVFSSTSGKMTHCVYWCPLGTILNYARFINPFRMYIDNNCSECMRCTKTCKYLALEKTDIEKRIPGFTCTMCGDCISSCHSGSIKYKLWNLAPERAHRIYIVITIAVYIVFLNVARI
jgi:polyferredoxin